MYTLEEIKEAVRNPSKIPREVNRLLHGGRHHDYNPDGICIFEEDWDNLIILDACRYDTFESVSDLDGTLDSRISRGGTTQEFIKGNFEGRTLHDLVYVTANSWFLKIREEIDTEIHDLIDLHYADPDGRYHDEEYGVVLPEVLTDHAIEAANEYPNKRLLIHYIQPHHPFLGPTGEQFQHRSDSFGEVVRNTESVTDELLRQAYRENLEIVLSSVERLLNHLEGRTVIAADHGEMLGDRHEFLPVKGYGHHPGVYNEFLTKVPWHVIDSGDRRRIVPEEPRRESEDVDVDALDERLRDLGYKV